MAAFEEDTECSMILIIGVTGVGKSYFINKLAAGSVTEGAGLTSETETCQVVRVGVGRTQVAVVDTPGFDDTKRSDADIVGDIVKFLCAQYELGLPLKGIIFMHRITDNKVSGTAQRYLEILRCLCGDNVLTNVILLTTMWSELRDQAVGFRREHELRKEFWSGMESKGSEIRSFDGSRAMAEGFVCRLMRKENIVLSIQKELVDEGRRLEETRVGRLIIPRLEQNIVETERTIEVLEEIISDTERPLTIEECGQLEEKMEVLRSQRQRQTAQLEKLREKPGREVASKIKREQRKQKWKNRVTLFASILGLVLTTTVNVILPLAGVIAF
jgi:GTPase SAR1 family protein